MLEKVQGMMNDWSGIFVHLEPNGYGLIYIHYRKQNTRAYTPEGAHMQKTRNKQNNIYRSMEDIYQ